MSVVESALGGEHVGVEGQMGFATGEWSRHVGEKIAKSSKASEGEVAARAVQLAEERQNNGDQRAGHVGFYLIGDGRETLERAMAMRGSLTLSLRRSVRRHALPLYSGVTVAVAALFTRALIVKAHSQGVRDWLLVLVAFLAMTVASQFVVTVINWLLTKLAKPELLPRMDFSRGVPAELRTLVAVPCMLTTSEGVSDLIGHLEVRFLANRDENVHFCLLSDFLDADRGNLPDHGPLLDLAQTGIEDLNTKYSHDGVDVFFLLHRPRRWNAGERRWMGYERKRGKLEELNGFLRDRDRDCFSRVVGRTAVLEGVRYVITLDADTDLPRDAVLQVVGTLAHPLSRPGCDDAKLRVTSARGMLEPSVVVSCAASNRSLYARLWSGDPGVDP